MWRNITDLKVFGNESKKIMGEAAVLVSNLYKCYQIYEAPRDRLKQLMVPKLCKTISPLCRFFTNEDIQIPSYYREFWALKNVSFEVGKGEAIGIIGRNGSGKSTLLQMICGTLNPTSGSIQTSGRIAALLELGSGFNPEFTGRENVYMNAAVLGLKIEEINYRFDDIAAFADIGEFLEQPVKMYSSGMVMRLAFAVAINVDPEILVVDEALSVGDEIFQRKCFSRIEAIRAKGTTILFVSHSGGQIVELCDRAILIDQGEKLAFGSPKHIVGRYQKLIYAPANKLEIIREQIRRADEQLPLFSKNISCESEQQISSTPHTEDVGEMMDPYLKPRSTIEYESHGAYIESPKVLTLAGEPVNTLVRGRAYQYTYMVNFSKSASKVRFGMLIKTVSGVELGGGVSSKIDCGDFYQVTAGSTCKVEFRFNCNLNPGVFFLNAGVVGDVDGNETYLHRIIDVAMFKVIPGDASLATGFVDFSCYPEITLL